MIDAYQDRLSYLYGRLNYERSGMPTLDVAAELRLGRMRRLLRLLGDPQDALTIVHVAGTKGKGSTSAMIAAGLSASGVKTGLFSSPHLHRLEERYRVDGVDASADEIVGLVDRVRPAVDRLDASPRPGDPLEATFFEITTAMGLLHFAERGAGAVVLEVGMGGRLDSTNVVRPAVGVITSISLDHTRQLGSTLGAIAREKAGIIKRNGLVVSGVRGDDARRQVERASRARSATLHQVDDDFFFDYDPPTPPVARPTPGRVVARTWRREWPSLAVPLLGEHQASNLATALATFDALADAGLFDVGPSDLERGFASMSWPARVEVLGDRPWFVVDGAHNVASAEALADTLRTHFPPVPRTIILGATREKDLAGFVAAIAPVADRIVATQYVENRRAVPAREVAEAVKDFGFAVPVELAETPAGAIEAARRSTPAAGLICATGSLFLAAEIREAWKIRADGPEHSSTEQGSDAWAATA